MDCTSCKAKNLQEEFHFCPYCGTELGKPAKCPNCGRETEPDAKFCPDCGTQLHAPPSTKRRKPAKPKADVAEIEPVSEQGITVEFLHSTSSNFEFALRAARAIPGFKQYGEEKKAVYRVAIEPEEIDATLELVEYLKGWRRRAVYADGEKVPWDSVFGFSWCYEKRKSSFKPELYCFGYEHSHQLNIWGCLQAGLPFTEHADWLTWGRWLNKKGDWEFDKERIKHELQKTLYRFRFCPTVQLDFVEQVLVALPSTVNPNRDKDWQFVRSWDDSTPGLVVTISEYGYKEKAMMIGVAPSGTGALQKIMSKVKGPRLQVQ